MKRSNISFGEFCDAFRDMGRQDQFTYAGKRALYDYLEEHEDSTGEEVELDVIALCCDYSEYSTAVECAAEYSYDFDKDESAEEQEESALEWLQNKTQVIVFDKGIIIAQF